MAEISPYGSSWEEVHQYYHAESELESISLGGLDLATEADVLALKKKQMSIL